MRLFAFLLALFSTLPQLAVAQQLKLLELGEQLPGREIVMKNTNGNDVSLVKALNANGLLVVFSCNTCPFVLKNQEVTNEVIRHALDNKVGIVLVNSNEAKRNDEDSYKAMKAYAKNQQFSIPYLIDEGSKLADLFGANHTPETFLFNKSGVLVYRGAMNDNPTNPQNARQKYLVSAIDAMIDGKKIEPATTKSIGCSIKRK
jgi:thioredoxin-related protein